MSENYANRSQAFRDLICKDYTGIRNVYKRENKGYYKGYRWTYKCTKNNKMQLIESKSIKSLKYKVLKQDLPWIIEDEERARKSYLDDLIANRKVPNFTGIYRVTKVKNPYNNYYGCWQYHYMENNEDVKIWDEDLKRLKERAKSYGFPWLILDKKTAKRTIAENNEYLNLFNSGIDRVTKIPSESSDLGFIWTYYYWENRERKAIRTSNLIVLERKIKEKKLPWTIFDKKAADESYNENDEFLKNYYQKTTSGIYLVFKHKDDGCKQGFNWCYKHYEGEDLKLISSVNLYELEEKVKSKNLPWIIIDEDLAEENYRLYGK